MGSGTGTAIPVGPVSAAPIPPSGGGGSGGSGGAGAGSGGGTSSPSTGTGPVTLAGQRLFTSFYWKHIVTDLNLETLTSLERLAANRRVVKTLNDALEQSLTVPSNDKRVNIPYTDGDPKVDEGTRLLIGFRHEGTGIWVVRATGIIMQVEDVPNGATSTTSVTAWDPWRYLDFLPVINDGTSGGAQFARQFAANITAVDDTPDTYRVDQVVTTLLTEAEANYNDIFIDYGQTAFFGGTIDNIPFPADWAGQNVSFPNLTSIGECLRRLCSIDDFLCDVVMQPIYDPANRPGIIVELNVSLSYGVQNETAIMSWDVFPRSLTGIDRLKDGTQRANNIQFGAGQGVPPVFLKTDTTSEAKFRRYYQSRFFPGQDGQVQYLEDLAVANLLVRANGVRTIGVSPTPERAKVPFLDYDIGDTVPVRASTEMREAVSEYMRVLQIPVSITDDALEQTEQLTVKATGVLAT